jgi:hypothetical protein
LFVFVPTLRNVNIVTYQEADVDSLLDYIHLEQCPLGSSSQLQLLLKSSELLFGPFCSVALLLRSLDLTH